MTALLLATLGRFRCAVLGHVLSDPTWLTTLSAYHDCERCGGQFVVKHYGEFAGALLPWDEDARCMFAHIGYKRDVPVRGQK